MQEIEVKEEEAGQRLDRFLAKYMPESSSGFFYKMMRKKNIVLNGKRAVGNERLAGGDRIKLFLADDTITKFRGVCGKPKNCHAKNTSDKFGIIYEDNDILVVNKPVGVLSQKSSKNDISLVEYITDYIGLSSNTFRPGICNRLDRNTSGIIVAGKSVRGLQWMNGLFRERNIKKFYLCIVKGKVLNERCIKGYLEKNVSHNKVEIYKSEKQGAVKIVTEYKPLQYGRFESQDYTLLKVHLITGKSHQIRAHLKSIGHPIIGDSKYGHKDVYNIFNKRFHLKHQLLHAWRLEFGDSGEMPEKYHGMVVTAEIPKQFKMIMDGLGMDYSLLKE